MTPLSAPPDKDALISALMARIEALVEQNARLTARLAELEATLGLPPKTPDNASTPPSKRQKPSGPSLALRLTHIPTEVADGVSFRAHEGGDGRRHAKGQASRQARSRERSARRADHR